MAQPLKSESSTSVVENELLPRFQLEGTALHRLMQEAAYLPRCSDNKTAALIRPRDYAIKHPYMQINRAGFVSWLIFDLDHDNAMIWQDKGLPAPNLIVQNRQSGHAHLYYAIVPVCTSERARSKPIHYMKAIYSALSRELNADPEYNSGPVAKTPGHQWWRTSELHNHIYELSELADCVELASASPWAKSPNLDAVSHSRNCMMFEKLRFYAYSIVNRQKEEGSFLSFTRLLEAFAHNHNAFRNLGFSADLSLSDLRATVKSVARWTWDKYTGSGRCHRGVMELDQSLPLPEKQALAAERTHSARRQKTEGRIRAACRALQQQGKALLHEAIAQAANLSRQTVAKYKHVLDEVKKPFSVLPLRADNSASLGVKFAEHQVSAPQGGFLGVGDFVGSEGAFVLVLLPEI
jgi:hypothetical protein